LFASKTKQTKKKFIVCYAPARFGQPSAAQSSISFNPREKQKCLSYFMA